MARRSPPVNYSPASQGAATALRDLYNRVSSTIADITSQIGQYFAEGFFTVTVETTPVDAEARIALGVKAQVGDATPTEASIFLDALSDGTSRIILRAGKTLIEKADGTIIYCFDGTDGTLLPDIIAAGTVTNTAVINLNDTPIPVNAGASSIPSMPPAGSAIISIPDDGNDYCTGTTGISGVNYGPYDKIIITLGEYATTSGSTTNCSFWLQKSVNGSTWTNVPETLVRYRQSVTPATQVFITVGFIPAVYPWVRLLVNSSGSTSNILNSKQIGLILKK